MSDPLAFFLTFRTYGTWIHGDERGSVDDSNNIPGTACLSRNVLREDFEKSKMRFPPLVLTGSMRQVVHAAIADECVFRGWTMHAVAVQSNHVHLVLAFAGVSPEIMVQRIKARATRWLRERKLTEPNRPVWADRPGSMRYLWKPEHVNAACAYVNEGQDTPR